MKIEGFLFFKNTYMSQQFDVVIMGGWPAGSALWTLLAQKWFQTVILDKDTFPRHCVWESLLPSTTDRFLKILGLAEKNKAMWFSRKYGGSYIWGESDKPWHLIFDPNLDNKIFSKDNISPEETQEILDGDYLYAYQVDRYRFDKMLVDRAREVGVDFRENTKVNDLIFDAQWKMTWVKTEAWEEFYGKLIVDASWRNGIIRNKLGIGEYNNELGFFAFYGYFKNCSFYDDFYSKYTQLVVSIDIWWIWFIHIGNGLVSVGVVSNDKSLKKEDFLPMLKKNPYIWNSIKNATQCDHLSHDDDVIYSVNNWSNIAKQFYGENFLLIGDAGGFVDPILSGGVNFAFNSAFLSYVHILKYFEKGNIHIFHNYEKIMKHDTQDYLALAKHWYGKNKVVDSYFWLAKERLGLDMDNIYNRMAFIYLSSCKHYSDRNLRFFNGELEIEGYKYDKNERTRIEKMMGWKS